MKNMKNKIIDLLIVILVYVFFSSLPYDLFIKDGNILVLIQALSKSFGLGFAVIFAKKSKSLETPKKNSVFLVNMLLIPCFVMVFNNMIYLSISKAPATDHFDGYNLLVNIIFIIVTAITEEYIFRYLILNNLMFEDKTLKIMISALIFGLFHIITFLSTFNPFDLIQIVYTTGLGIVLGFYYEYGKNIIFPIIFHMLFNFFNSYMFSLYIVTEYDLAFYIVSAIDAIIVLGYIAILYFGVFKKYYSIIEKSN